MKKILKTIGYTNLDTGEVFDVDQIVEVKDIIEVNNTYKSIRGTNDYINENLGYYFHLLYSNVLSLNLEPQYLIRFLKLCCYTDYKNKLVTGSTRGKKIKANELEKILNLSRNETSKTKTYLINQGLIKIDDDKTIEVNNAYVKRGQLKGNLIDMDVVRVFNNGFNRLYDGAKARQHKKLVTFIKILPYLNINHNIICTNPMENIIKIEEMALLGELDTLIIFNLDRIGRTTEGTEFIKRMTYSNVKVLSVTEGLLNSGNDTDELINGIKFWMAQQESKKISLRSKNGKEAANKKGLFAGGPVNFGYGVVNQKMFVIPEEAEIVKLIFDLYIKHGKNETVRYLQEKNITKRGRKFSQHMIHDLLKDTIYIGLKRYNQWQKVSTDPTDKKRKFNKETLKFQEYKEELRILDDKTFYKAQELIDKRTSSKDRTKYTNRTNALFEGLLWHRCGDGEIRKLHLDNKKDKYGNIIILTGVLIVKETFIKMLERLMEAKSTISY